MKDVYVLIVENDSFFDLKKKIFLYTMTSTQKRYLKTFGFIAATTSVMLGIQYLFERANEKESKIWWLDWRLKSHAKILDKIQDDLEKIQDDLELKK